MTTLTKLSTFTYNYGIFSERPFDYMNPIFVGLYMANPLIPFVFLAYLIYGLIAPDSAYDPTSTWTYVMSYFSTATFFGGAVFTIDQAYTWLPELLLTQVFCSYFAHMNLGISAWFILQFGVSTTFAVGAAVVIAIVLAALQIIF